MQVPVEYAIDGGSAVLREARTPMVSAAPLGLDTSKYLWRFSDASTSVGPGDVVCSDLSAYVPQTCTLSSEVSLGGGADGNQSTVQVITAMARIAASWREAPLTQLARQAAPSDLLLQRAIVALASGNNSAASTAAASTGALDGATKLGYWLEQFRDVMSEAPGKVRSLAVLSSVLDEALHTCSATILELSREEPLALGASCDGDECPVWTSPPDWTVATLHATHPWLESAQVGARYGGGWEVTILTVDLQFTLHGSLRCPMSPALNVKLQVRQEAAALRFYRYCLHNSQCGNGFDADAAAAAAARLSVDGVGIVRMGVANASLPGHVWWHDYEALQLRRDRITPEAVCAQLGGGNSGDANSVVVEVRLEFDESLPLIAPAVVPLPLSVALGGVRPASPLPVHVAPMVVCSVACAASSHTLVQLPSEAVSWNLSDDVPHKLVPCLDGLLSDYARCGRSKAVSDAAFARCVGGGPADMLAVPGWWLNRSSTIEGSIGTPPLLQVAVTLGGLTEEAHSLAGLLACSFYTDVQRVSCACSSGGGLDLARMLASRQGLLPTTTSMRCLSHTVGVHDDARAQNWPEDVLAVADRLRALGYLGERQTDAQRNHAARTFLCASAGVHAFEQPCDDEPGPCKVGGDICTLPTQRSTCLLPDVPCAQGLIDPDSEAHSWLRAARGAGWTSIPLSGDGYVVARSSGGMGYTPRYGTTWLLEALTVAGRLLLSSAADAAPFAVVAAAGRTGGFVQGLPEQHQTGLQLQLNLSSVPTTSAVVQIFSLERAGFKVSIAAPPGAWPSVCAHVADLLCEEDSAAAFAYIRAALSPPLLLMLDKLPLVLNASLTRDDAAREHRSSPAAAARCSHGAPQHCPAPAPSPRSVPLLLFSLPHPL